jgi:subtilase family serine protease
LIFSPSASQKAALQTLIAQQQDPNSSNFHKWITPEQYAERFGMSADDLNKVTGWLKSQGLTVDGVSRSRTKVSFGGSVSRIESVFQTEFHQYMVNGEKHFANSAELSLPAALAGTVLGFRNLDNFRMKPRNVRPRFTSDISGNTFLAPADVATIYNINPLYNAGNAGFDGTGQRIVVVGQTQIDANDIAAFRSASGLSAKAPLLLLMPGSGTSVTVSNDVPEADLDVEWSGAVAKNAAIIYVYSGNAPNFSVIDAFEYSIDNDLAPVISISYGACEALNGPTFITFLQNLMQQATAQGQAVSSAVGDVGATDCDAPTATIATHGLAVDVPGAIPEVTGVGGTTFTGDDNHNPTFWNASNDPSTGGSAKSYIPETTWNDGQGSATGGGVSSVIAKPSFQTALTPADGHRDVPDIALSASPDHDPYLFCTQGRCVNGFRSSANGLQAVGGTSVGAPVFAGMLTLINQATESAAGQGGAVVNQTLYTLAASTPSAFHDISTGNNKQTCQGGSTGCTSANSHSQVAEQRSGLPAYAGLMLLPLCAVFISVGRRRWTTVLGMFCVLAIFSAQIACGGGSSNNNGNTTPPPPPPPTNLSIGWSAGTGYDLVTGLGSVNASVLANAWPGYTTSPAFDFNTGATITTTTTTPGTATLTVNSAFSGTVDFTCVAIPVNATCTLNPTSRTLNNGAMGTTTLTVNASTAGTYLVAVTGTSGSVSHSVNVPVTVN